MDILYERIELSLFRVPPHHFEYGNACTVLRGLGIWLVTTARTTEVGFDVMVGGAIVAVGWVKRFARPAGNGTASEAK